MTRSYKECNIRYIFFSDVDECLEIGGKYGHHCQKDQRCVNTIGAYNCSCLSGHFLTDNHSCSTTSGVGGFLSATCLVKCSISVIAAWMCLLVLELIYRWWLSCVFSSVVKQNLSTFLWVCSSYFHFLCYKK